MSPIQYLPMVIDRLASRFHPLKIILFGSLARDKADTGSDIDLLVIFKELTGKRRDQTIQLISAVADLPIGVDCVVATDKELKDNHEKRYSILTAATKEGRVVYESN